MVDVRAALTEHLGHRSSPVLFVGSGLPRRYAGAENWEGLLRRFAAMTARPYDYYRSQADGNLPAVATKIAQAFYDIWWDDEKFEASREKYAADLATQESPLKVEVALHLSGLTAKLPTPGPLADELDLLRKAVVDAVITTNYDDLLPTLFPDFRSFVGQDGLLFANSQGIGELYQIHGSVTEPDSLVLTEADYQRFEERNAYLAAKLMTIFVEHPVIFLGYSLSDRNIHSILRSIAGCLTENNIGELRDQLIFIEWAEGTEPSVGPHTFMIDGFVLPVLQIKIPNFTAAFTALAELHRSFPAKLLRRLKEQIYDLVLTDDPHHRLVVADIEDTTDDRDLDVVFGVGIHAKFGQEGYVGLTRDQLVDDILGNRASYDPHQIVYGTLPRILPTSGYVPIYKYLRGVGALDDAGAIKSDANVSDKITRMADKIRGGMSASAEIARKAPAVLAGINSITELEAEHGEDGVLNYGTCMPPDRVDPDQLRDFLNANPRLRDDDSWRKTQYIKLTCFLDWLENGWAKPDVTESTATMTSVTASPSETNAGGLSPAADETAS
jgi:hypothetical protein